MKKTTVRELHLRTSAIISAVASGEAFLVEKRGRSVAEIRPAGIPASRRRLPDRERVIARLRRVRSDSGAILEQDRS